MPTPEPAPAWPFPTRDPSQYRRIDQGWDLQYGGTSAVTVVAAEAGVLSGAGPDPNGFGIVYPLLTLKVPVAGNPAIYYGHTFPVTSLFGREVARGEVIAHTGYPNSGGNAYSLPNWLEIGWWNNGPTGDGASMQAWLSGGTPVPGGGTVPGGGVNFNLPLGGPEYAKYTKMIAASEQQLAQVIQRIRAVGMPGSRP